MRLAWISTAAISLAVVKQASGCQHHGMDHDKQWTEAELEELERKWGFEVMPLV
jgi:hypothetical protein